MTSNAQQPKVRTGQGEVKLSREEFSRRFSERFYDPEFQAIKSEIDRVMEVAWKVYDEYHKSPRTRKAGPEFQDPEFDLPVEWLETRKQIQLARKFSGAMRRYLIFATFFVRLRYAQMA